MVLTSAQTGVLPASTVADPRPARQGLVSWGGSSTSQLLGRGLPRCGDPRRHHVSTVYPNKGSKVPLGSFWPWAGRTITSYFDNGELNTFLQVRGSIAGPDHHLLAAAQPHTGMWTQPAPPNVRPLTPL